MDLEKYKKSPLTPVRIQSETIPHKDENKALERDF